MRVMMGDLLGTNVLAGATAGAYAMSRLIAETRDKSGAVFLDFDGIEAATGSFLRECVLGFRDYCRRVQVDIYPVVANAPSVVEEELRDVLIASNDAFVCCGCDGSDGPLSPRVIGRLEQTQLETLRAVVEAGQADASKLSASSANVGITAWNNRLASLVSKGLLTERKTGRQKVYSPVVKGMSYGC